ncbi:transcriptional activator, Rgg/GadR/MutR family, C-terminal domain-containing protein [Streptococcus gallolyticus]|uniref:Transcriptional activator, Rgg/GadR/MutR family, C-terminal domain-containing protein n=1 Tax=Streptococcus gallolyticus TaxID=315405 RepID=A0A1H9SS27_9STRE|nr:Rgg/GadR/MutR family transcriptional regulator [Streptococcus gallolyticus]SEF22660.1 transcriptional activator, Rgg/GadR/MutR family, C-terminal domain-containing protein [Streptococcus gallolyticus]SEM35246.1 transcriptional activator, Rgg/GadR/MutR family, C-terminal domain-containing protein [Streptococcus gallolyticus]SER87668.1 transcriptional activator, Rgg/GadR/MutR family, C-terminal domain-containing protein [Streptococcus gallolyticus]
MLGKSVELGELFKELRLARGLKLKDVARENLSASQLSKFENGQTMLAADKLLLAIQGIHMTFSEFGYALMQYQESDIFKIGRQLVELQAQKDLEGLKTLLENYQSQETYEVYHRLNKLVLKSAIYSLEPSFEITNEEKEFLITYLYAIEEWTEYELYLFGNTLFILSDEDLIFLGKAFIERNKLYKDLTGHKKRAELVLINLILVLVEHRDFYYASYFISSLEKMLNYQDMFARVVLNFLKKVMNYIEDETVDLSDVEAYIDLIEQLDNPTLVIFLRTNLEQIVNNQ